MGRATLLKRVRRVVRLQRRERLEMAEQSARVGIDMGWRYNWLFRPAVPVMRWVLPAGWVAALGNRAVSRARWRIDQGNWRAFDPPYQFTAADFGS